jgi:hypothetical protein
MAFFSQTNVMINFLKKEQQYGAKNPPIFSPNFFGENINHNIDPWGRRNCGWINRWLLSAIKYDDFV